VASATPTAPREPAGPTAFDHVLDASARGTAALLEPPDTLRDDASRAARGVVDTAKGIFATPSTPTDEPAAPTPKAPPPKSPKPVAPKIDPAPKPDPEPKPDPQPPEPEPTKPSPSGRNLAKLVGDGIQLKAEVQFDPGSAKLSAGTSALLDDVALVMLGSGKSFCVEGHTAATGADKFNRTLGAKRASAVRKALLLRTVPESRLEVRSFGEMCPIADNETEEGRRKNSRIEIVATCACE
jgi:outer membrane protein OmpA-like peptidoglycan-associated protein